MMEKDEAYLPSMLDSKSSILFLVAACTFIAIRVLYAVNRSGKPVRTLIVLAAGRHTAEMLNLLSMLQNYMFSPRYYIAAATDNMSLQKARVFEETNGYIPHAKITIGVFSWASVAFLRFSLGSDRGRDCSISADLSK